MNIELSRQILSGAFLLGLTVLFPVTASSQGLVEYALILCLVPDDAQDEYELCGTNVSDGDETATFVFKPSSEYIASEEFPLDLGPNETKCLTYTPTVAGVLSERVYGPPGLAKNGVTIISPSEWSAMARNTSTQVWLKANGKRAALVSLLLPAVQSCRECGKR